MACGRRFEFVSLELRSPVGHLARAWLHRPAGLSLMTRLTCACLRASLVCTNRVMGLSSPSPVGSRRTRRGQWIWIPAADRDTFNLVGMECQFCRTESLLLIVCARLMLFVPQGRGLTVDNVAGLLTSHLARCCEGNELLGQPLRSYFILGVGFGR